MRTSNAWRGAIAGLLVATIFVLALTIGEVFLGPWPVLSLLIFSATMLIAFLLPVWILSRIVRLVPGSFRWTLLAAMVLLFFPFVFADVFGALITAAAIALGASLLGASLWYLLLGGPGPGPGTGSRAGRIIAISGLLAGLAATLGGGIWLFSNGHEVPAPVNAALLEQSSLPLTLNLPDPSKPGPYIVKTLSYGSGSDLHHPEYAGDADLLTKTVDGSALIKNWSGITGRARTRYWGFDPGNLPLNGLVWYPDGKGPFPLVLILHGNYLMEGRSEAAFAYLAEHLASHGYIAVAVDENFLNTSWYDAGLGGPETRGRAWLLLQHLSQWHDWNESDDNPFYRGIDIEKIALVGHSRGGESVLVAAAFNHLPYLPEDAGVEFDFGYNIRSVVSLAQIDGQYQPRGQGTPLENLNFLTLHGAYDGDAVSFGGSAQYERVRFTDGGDWFKAGIYIYAANHSNFTTEWVGVEKPAPTDLLFNQKPLMSPAEQHRLAKACVFAFLEASMNGGSMQGSRRYLPMFRDVRTARHWLPETVYLNQYLDSRTRIIAAFEEDIDLTTASLPGARVSGENLSNWYEDQVQLKWGPKGSHAVYLGWQGSVDQNPGPRYTISLRNSDWCTEPGCTLTFALADVSGNSTHEGIDISIELGDRNGNTARLGLKDFSYLQPRLRAQYMKADILNSAPAYETVFQTFFFPLSKFVQENPLFEPADIKTISFIFDRTKQGLVALDDIGIRVPVRTENSMGTD
jgi:dienelactone hydrolase